MGTGKTRADMITSNKAAMASNLMVDKLVTTARRLRRITLEDSNMASNKLAVTAGLQLKAVSITDNKRHTDKSSSTLSYHCCNESQDMTY